MSDLDRLKIWILPEELIVLVLSGLANCNVFRWPPPRAMEIPADAKIERVHYDIGRRAFLLMIHSKDFRPVPPGAEIPIHEEPLAPWMFEARPIDETHQRV